MSNAMTLQKILRDRLAGFSYKDLTKVRPSGMTRMQEWLRTQGIREDTDSRDGYVAIPHPAAWTRRESFDDDRHLLLVPTELAVKITTLGHIP
jgi:hypothetical protein